MQKQLERNLEAVRARIAAAARGAGRRPAEIGMVAVTKSVPAALAEALVALGQQDLGENRVDELERKAAHLAARGRAARWHLVGHLQANKVRRAVRAADVLHSIDSAELLARVDRIAGAEGRRPEVYLQVKLADEPAKSGLAPDQVRDVAGGAALRHARLVGLMGIAPLPGPFDTPEDVQRSALAAFERLAVLARALEADPVACAAFAAGRVRLSIGMSGDLEASVRAGSDVVRIGSALFSGVDAAEARG